MRITVFVNREDPEMVFVFRGYPTSALKKFAKELVKHDHEVFPTIGEAEEHIEGWYRWDDYII